MLFRAISLALCTAFCGMALTPAQAVAEIAGPVNTPPSGFKGQQFVDNRGCVFMRAGYSGQTNWVPRVTRDRKAMCGYPPTFGAPPVSAAVKDAPKPAKVVPAAAKAPYAATPPKTAYKRRAAQGAKAYGAFGCYAEAADAGLAGGTTAIVCTRGHGAATGGHPTRPVAVAVVVSQPARTAGKAARTETVVIEPVPTPPKGYELAWKDDRLNPWRGIGTDAGWAAQDQIWTRTVPARMVTKKRLPVAQQRRALGY